MTRILALALLAACAGETSPDAGGQDEPSALGPIDLLGPSIAAAIAEAETHGLRAEHYAKLAPAEAFVAYAADLAFGRLDPRSLEPDWRSTRRRVDVLAAYDRVSRGAPVADTLESLAPPHPQYRALRGELARYRSMSWAPLGFAAGTELGPGARGAQVSALTARLAAEGFITGPSDDYNAAVEAAVRAFQERRGLPVTGVVAGLTLAQLDVPAADRARQIEVNLERWRWLPDDLGRRHVIVNIPGFALEAWIDGERALAMKIIVGKQYRRTPVFSGPITSAVLNPTWGVPRRLAIEDKLPQIKKDPGYLARGGYQVYRGGAPVDPAAVDWSKVTARSFPYQLRQASGPGNALGRVKLEVANEFDVYLHDTNEPGLFARPSRALSSGCIRVEKPRELAELVLAGTGWDRRRIDQTIASNATVRVRATAETWVHLTYQTAWVDGGELYLRPDIDGRDQRLNVALTGAKPADPRAKGR